MPTAGCLSSHGNSQATARREFRENLFRHTFLHRNGTSNGRELTMLLVLIVAQKRNSLAEVPLKNLFRQCFLHRNGTSNGRELTMLLVLIVAQKRNSLAEVPLKNLFRQCFLHRNGTSNGRELTMLLVPLKKASAKAKAFLIAYLDMPSCTATAQATVIPTIGLLPAPIRPIISTCAGTEEEPANCASECIRPIVSVMP